MREHFKNCEIKIAENDYDMAGLKLAPKANDKLKCSNMGKNT